ncbi:Phosphotransferase enzyme family protein [Nocardioides exalbidus]|uniref:Phosphotransferase enzyme family protein n=1 Tax=Nocardioides exalbidus TaxID=402596 RepID=A0A1H4VQB4_9ACTN|nr:aminoglycoside phosphotransferase family protein [Nocardioides exalbidus]SEC82611.1 Phosphotransferase enzyme family protein [Nocardioides exalbidus]
MTAPRAVGVRLPYGSVPAAVRSWVEGVLGSPVVSVAEQVGGMSPGCATRLTCADGTRAFVKAVGDDLNPDTPNLFRREAAVLSHLGEHRLWARLLASYDDGAWVALLIEDVEGRHPDFADGAELEAVLAGADRLSEALRERGEPPSARLLDVGDVFGKWADTLDALPSAPPGAPVPDWLVSQQREWSDVLRAQADVAAAQLVHWDVRIDNLLRRPDGDVVFVDWGMAARGPAWVDPLLARMERMDDPWFDTSITSSPALVGAGDDAVTAFLAGFGAHLAVRSVTAVDVNLPTINDFRRTESRRMLAAVARRTGRRAS